MCLRKAALAGLVGLSAISFAQKSSPKPPKDSKTVVVELKVTPVYPPSAAAQQLFGDVVVQVSISETGDVFNAKVTSGDPTFSGAALTAARQWKFEPFYKGGKAEKVSAPITFHFEQTPPAQPDTPAVATSTSTPVRIALLYEKKTNTHCPNVQLLHKATPQYPHSAVVEHVQGDVMLYLFIDETGEITKALPLAGPDVLRDATMAAVKDWKYAPYTCDGQPTRVEMAIESHFWFQ